ncbi:hypothetical protein QR680_006494 [Steinernema hermaphroditum]|uniref:Uncharacterized protein n=1 Tax=Steinernema hermaphroditum TaxID=289476 RepID=A0AA39HVS5_9BILA|nr:hypothetical protein QR680_006494 [Steinernema hermaphroditum]
MGDHLAPSTSIGLPKTRFTYDILDKIFSFFDKEAPLRDVRSVSTNFCDLADRTVKLELELMACYDGIKVETKINKRAAVRKIKLDSLDWSKKSFVPVLKYGCHKLSVECEFKDKQFSPFLPEVADSLCGHPESVFKNLSEFEVCLNTDVSYAHVLPANNCIVIDTAIPRLIQILRPNMKRIQFFVFPAEGYMDLYKKLVALKPKELQIAASEVHLSEMLDEALDNFDTKFNVHIDRIGKMKLAESRCLYKDIFGKLAQRWSSADRIHHNYINIIHQCDHLESYRQISKECKTDTSSWNKPLTICPLLQTHLFVGKGVITFYVAPKEVHRFEHAAVGRTDLVFKATRQCAVYVVHNNDREVVNRAVLRVGETLEATSTGCMTTHIYICDVPDDLLPHFSFELFGGAAAMQKKKLPLSAKDSHDLPVEICWCKKRGGDSVDTRLEKARKLGF